MSCEANAADEKQCKFTASRADRPVMHTPELIVRDLGLCEYQPVWQQMQQFTRQRRPDTADEIWLLEHQPVFTLGQAGKPEHILDRAQTPVIKVDRGGQVTYHGPGQLIAYLMLDLRRLNVGVRQLVELMEQAVIGLLAAYQVDASARRDAPGVYVDGRKIAALGLRVSRGCSFHGLSLNVDMDLQPFERINPCGYPGLPVTRLADLHPGVALPQVKLALLSQLRTLLGYNPGQSRT